MDLELTYSISVTCGIGEMLRCIDCYLKLLKNY